MGGLADYFPRRAWVAVLGLLGVAVLPFFVPPEIGVSAGLTIEQYLLVVGVVELAAALGIAALVVHYRTPVEEREESEWRYKP